MQGTPNQLFTSGAALQLRESGLTALDSFDNVNDYGVEEEGDARVEQLKSLVWN